VKNQFLQAFIIGLVAVAVAVGVILFMQRGAHMELTGSMKVAVHETDPNTSLAIFTLHLNNPADYGFEVSNITVTLVTDKGEFPTTTVGKADTERLAASMPDFGAVHPALYTHYVIPARSSGDYTVLAQYSAPEKVLNDRKRFTVQIQEINGKVADFAEK
jgi:hypothetical protein